MDDAIRLLVECDVRLYYDSVVDMLACDPDLQVVRSIESSRGTAEPSVALVDVAIGDGPRRIQELAQRHPACKILALGVSEAAKDLIACAEAGAVGYILRSDSLPEVIEAVRSAATGQVICPPRVAAALLERLRSPPAERTPRLAEAQLTGRELEVLRLMAERLSNKEIASRLSIEVTTVKNHVHSILTKLGLRRRAEVAAWFQALTVDTSLN